jgi:thiamine-monophosphate kinase
LGYLEAHGRPETHNPTADEQFVLERYHHPQPRLKLGVALRHLASAAIDVSDGLLADLNHILEASAVGASVERARVPISPALTRLKGDAAIDYALHSGDDYELCATIPKASWANASQLLKQQLTVIGVIESAPGLRLDGADVLSGSGAVGFDHFRRKA